jgi:hypothetical protein
MAVSFLRCHELGPAAGHKLIGRSTRKLGRNRGGDTITVADLDGEMLVEHARPALGVTYIGNGIPLGQRPTPAETSPKS